MLVDDRRRSATQQSRPPGGSVRFLHRWSLFPSTSHSSWRQPGLRLPPPASSTSEVPGNSGNDSRRLGYGKSHALKNGAQHVSSVMA